ncbi:YolD-like family protein [Paenibacillus sp. HJGM_3]|uniref:YolD-like family protein n=1 Tax=Paenibacillus sp. HJGM_3 TaxID=3379816 RepID=UPI00385AD006
MKNVRTLRIVHAGPSFKPIVDELQLHDFSVILFESYTSQTMLEFTLFGGIENYTIQGVVDRIDKTMNRFRIAVNGQYEWIRMTELVNIEPMLQKRYS